MMIMICIVYETDYQAVTEIVPASGSGAGGVIPRGAGGVIPLSVEMLSDSDDEDCKPQIITTATQSSVAQPGPAAGGPSAGSVNGKSKLLLLKMATEFVEAAAARQPANHCMFIAHFLPHKK